MRDVCACHLCSERLWWTSPAEEQPKGLKGTCHPHRAGGEYNRLALWTCHWGQYTIIGCQHQWVQLVTLWVHLARRDTGSWIREMTVWKGNCVIPALGGHWVSVCVCVCVCVCWRITNVILCLIWIHVLTKRCQARQRCLRLFPDHLGLGQLCLLSMRSRS